jgi:IclR family acetate operon transcriptional repressor
MARRAEQPRPRTPVGKGEEGPKYAIESVDNALRLLLLLRETRSVGVQQASEALGVAPSTAHRLFAMLQHRGFAEQDPATRTYRAGPVLAELGLSALQELDIRRVARPRLERLVTALDETAHLVVLRGTSVLFIDCVEPSRILRAGSRIGQTLPAHATASGKALLAALPDERLLELFPDERLESVTRRTQRSRRGLLLELARVRELGYALNDGESEEELVAVAAVILSSDGTPHGAITVAVPATRYDAGALERIVPAIRAAAAETGEALP